MEFTQKFKDFLFALTPAPSKVTVKNYTLDVKHFVDWFEKTTQQKFNPALITKGHLDAFHKDTTMGLSARSLDRHMSSLRKFFQAMKLQGFCAASPFEQASQTHANTDPFKLKQFKDFLYVYNASNLTIKNYIIDLRQFFSWATETLSHSDPTFSGAENVLSYLTPDLLAMYRQQLIDKGVFSGSSVNRKLSSLRKYIAWAESQHLIENENGLQGNPNVMSNIVSAKEKELPKAEIEAKNAQGLAIAGVLHRAPGTEVKPSDGGGNRQALVRENQHYSPFPPFRLAQKITKGINLMLDGLVVAPLAHVVRHGHKAVWQLQGKPLFVASKKNLQAALKGASVVKNLPRAFYHPLTGAPVAITWYDKLWFHARHTRPNWYRKYHSLAIAHYFNWAILAIVIAVVGFGFYNSFVQKPKIGKPLLAAAQPNRILSFQGRLTDNNNNAITTATNLRFGIYTDQTSSGSALLWQEVDNVTPDSNGVFSVLLGKNSSIQQALFANNANLYLGVTVETTPELTPRQQLATVAYATNAETLQGLPPITQSGAGTSNVVLALNSAGNLSIGAASTFQTVGGTFTLAGDTLVLNTNAGTNGNITVAPDGGGFIDLQKPLINSTQNNNIPSSAGSVEVDDTFAILATNSGVPALTINQNSVGTLIAASVSGSSVFTVANSGAITDSNYTTAGGILYANSNGLFLQTTAGTGGQCLTSSGGGAPTWGACGSGGTGTNFWTMANGALYPVNTTLDLLLGGTATSGANFAFINNTPGSGTPTASISGNLTLNSAGQIQTTNNQPLTVGGSSTGNIILSPNNGNGTLTINASTISVSGSIIPTSTSVNLGSPANYFGNAYITNLFSSPNTQYFGFWQLNSGVLSPINSTNDLAVGGIATGGAKFQVFGNTGNATTTGTLTFNTSGQIQTTNNQSLTLGGNATGGIILSPNNGSGTVTINGLSTGIVHSTNGVLSSSFVNLATEVTGTLPINHGGTNATAIGSAGSVAYSNGTSYAFTAVGSTNDCLISNGSGAPTWGSCSTAAGANNWWTLDSGNGVLYPINSTLDLFVGGSSTASANFAFINNAPGSGTPTASISGNLTLNSAGQIQTTKNQPLTIGGNATGGITLSPNNGSGIVTLNTGTLNTTKSSFDLVNTTATTINFAGAATSVNIGNSGGSTTVNGGLVVAGATNLNGNTTLGDTTGDTINFTGRVNSSIVPSSTDTYDLGASGLEWNNLYVKNIISGGTVSGFWQRILGVLSPTYSTDDLAIGGTSTSAAKFQIFANSGNATTTGTLTFNTNGQIQTTNNQTLTLGGNATGNIILSPNNGSGIVTVNGSIGSNLIPSLNLTYDLGSSTKQWNNVYAGSIFSNGLQLTQLFQKNSNVVSPLNISDDLAIGGTATSTAKFQIFGTTGNATTTGTLTFNTSGQIQTTNNQSLTLGGNSTGNIIFSPNNGNGTVTINGTIGSNLVPATTNTYDLGSSSLEWNNLYVNNIISGGTIAGFFQKNSNVISPLNISDDLAIGGTATGASKFQIFGTTGNATTTGTLTFNTSGQIQTTKNQPLTLGGDSTGGIILSPNNGLGTVTITGLGTGVVHSTNGLLSSSAVDLGTSDVTGTLPISRGGTNTTAIGSAGSVAYSDGSKYAFTAVGSTGNCLVSNGSGAPQWVSCASAANNNYWTLDGGSGVLYPINTTLDVLFGGASSTSANFAFLNNAPGSGTSTASISGNVTLNSAGQIQTTKNQPLTIGGNSTGGITIAPNNGSGTLALNAANITTNQTTLNLFNTTATTANVLGAATNISIGNSGGSATFNGGLTVAADTALNGNTTIGDANVDRVTFNAEVNSNILPSATDTYDLGSSSLEWNNIYAKNIISGGSVSGFWQRFLGVLSPFNITDDLAIGGTATSTAKFQVFGLSGNATTTGTLTFGGTNGTNLIAARNNAGLTIGDSQTGNIILNGGNVGIGTTNPGAKLDVNGSATISGNLTLNSAASIQTTNNQPLTLGGNSTGNIILSPNSGSGIITINGKFNSNLLPQAADTYDLGAANLEWNNLYVKNIISGGNIAGFWQRNSGVVAPTNITDDLAVGGVSTAAAKFQIFGNSGNATTTGTLTFDNSLSQIQTTKNQPLTLGGNATGGITLSPNNGNGTVTVNGTSLQTTSSTFNAFTTTATSLNLGVTGGTTTVNSALTVTGTSTLNGNVVLGATNSNTIAANGQFTTSLIPNATNSFDLGSNSLRWRNLFLSADSTIAGNETVAGTLTAGNLLLSAGAQYGGFWQLNNGALSPTNITNDILVGGVSTAAAKFQIFGNSGNATTTGTLTFNTNGQIQTTNNQSLTLGGSSTGNIILKPNNGSGSITINGSFNSNLLPTTTDTYDLGSAAQEWNTIYVKNIVSSGNLSGFWQRNLGTLSPSNITDDILGGATATNSAKFAVLNMTGSGTPTASVSSGLSGTGAFFDANGNFQTVRNAGLTIGGNSTGNITLSPLNGNGSVSVNGVALNTTKSSFDLLNTIATTINFGGSATTISVGNSGGTTTVNGALAVAGSTNLNGNTTIGDATTDTVAFTARVNSNILPNADLTYDLGSSALRWNNVYAGNLQLPVSGGTGGYWTLGSSVLSPTNSWNDVVVGGSSTSSAKFQIFANSGNATTAGNLTFNGNGQIQTTNNTPLTLGGNSTGNIILKPNNGSGSVTVNGFVGSNLIPSLNNTYDLGSLSLQWNNIYGHNIYQDGQPLTQIFQRNLGVIAPLNITDDLAIGGTATSTAKFQVFGLSGNATTTGTLTFGGTNGTNLIAARNNAGLTIGDSQTGNIILNGGNVGIGTTLAPDKLTVNGNIQASSFKDFDDTRYFLDPAASGIAETVNGSITVGTLTSQNKLDVNGSAAFGSYGGVNAAPVNGLIASGYVGFGTTAVGNGALVVNQTNFSGLGDIFAASASGTTKFVVTNDGTVGIAANVNDGTVLSKSALDVRKDSFGNALALFKQLSADTNADIIAASNSAGVNEFRLTNAGVIQARSFQDLDNTAYFLDPTSSTQSLIVAGTVGVGTTSPLNLSGIDIEKNSQGNSALVVANLDASNRGDLFTASNSAGTKFAIQNDGTLVAKKYSTDKGILYLNGTTGTIAETAQGASNTVLHGNGSSAPTFSAVDLTADVGSSILPLANGGTNNNLTPSNGGVVYSDASKLQILAGTAIAGQCLISGSSSAPSWGSCGTGQGTNWWTMSAGGLYPINSTLDFFLGGTASSTAKFAVLNMTGSGTPTASIAGNLTFNSAGLIQTTNNQPLTVGGDSTGNIILKPNNGNGTVTFNAPFVDDSQSTATLFNTPTNITLAAAATTLTIGNASGTTTFASDVNSSKATLALFATPTTINFGAGATSGITIGASNTPITLKGDTTLGNSATNNIVITGSLNADLIPTGNGSINIGSPTHYYGTVYANTFVSPVSGGVSGFWQLSNSVLSPVNYWNDLAVGGNASGSATPFQVFATTSGVDTAGTATTSGGLSFRGTNTNVALLNGSVLNIKTSVGGDSGLGTVLTIANNGNITQSAGNFTTSGNVAVNGGSLTTTQTTANLFDSANSINIGTSGTGGGIGIGNSTGNNTIHGNLQLGDSSSNTINPTAHFSNDLIPDTDNNRSLGSLALRWKNLFLSGTVTAANVNLPVSGGTDGYWTLASSVLSPTNIWNDLAIGGTATSTAKFQVFSNTGNATTTGTLTFNSGSQGGNLIAARDNQGLTIGDSQTGNIIFGGNNIGIGTTNPTAALQLANSSITDQNPLVIFGDGSSSTRYQFLADRGSGGEFQIRSGTARITTTGDLSLVGANGVSSVYITNPVGNVGIGATSLLGNAQFVVNQRNNSGLGDLFTASASGVTKFTIANDGTIKNSLIPNLTDTYNLGSDPTAGGKEWDTLYVRQIVTPNTGGLAGFWQLSSGGVLAPANLTNDLAIGGTATSTAKFQIFGNTGNATTTGTLTFNSGSAANNLIAAANLQGLTIGNSSTGNIFINNGSSAKIGINTTTPGSYFSISTARLELDDADGNNSDIAQRVAGGSYGVHYFLSSRGTLAAPTATLSNDILGSLSFQGFGTTDYGSGSTIQAVAEGTFTNNGGPTSLRFSTNTGAGLNERMRISSVGKIGIGTSTIGNSQLVVNQTNNSGLGDIFSASASGTPEFTINNNGYVAIGPNTTTAQGILDVASGGPNFPSDMTLGQASGTNWVANPSFEGASPLNTWNFNHAPEFAATNTATESALFGGHALRLNSSRDSGASTYNYAAWSSCIPVLGNTNYVGSMSFFVKSGYSGNIGVTYETYTTRDCTGSQTGTSTVNATTTGQWTRVSNPITTGASVASIQIYATTSTGAVGIAYIDGVQFEQGSTASPYMDGSLGPGYYWDYTGTPNATDSSRLAGSVFTYQSLNSAAGIGAASRGTQPTLQLDQNGSGNLVTGSVSGTLQFAVTNSGILQGRSFQDLDDTRYFIDPASSGTAGTFNGSVGIGTTSPAVTLDVHGASKTITSNAGIVGIYSTDTQAADTGGSIVLGGQDGSGSLNRGFAGIYGFKENGTSSNYNGYLAFATRSNGSSLAEAMRIDSSGNVGIGTTAPGATLDVVGSGATAIGGTSMSSILRTSGGSLATGLTANLNLASIGFKASSNSVALGIHAYRDTAGGTDWTTTSILLGMDVDNTASAGAFLSLSHSNGVGINTAKPLADLHLVVNGAASALSSVVGRGMAITANAAGRDRLYFENTAATTGQRVLMMDNGNTSGVLSFSSLADNAGSFVTQNIFNIKYNGNVGIGTTNPGSPLDISGGSTDKVLQMESSNTGQTYIDINNTTGHEFELASGGSANTLASGFYIYDVTAAARRLNIDSSGNMGVNTTTMTEMFNVNGRVAANGYRTRTGTAGSFGGNSFNINWTAGGCFNFWVDTTNEGQAGTTCPSDQRLKTDVQPIGNALSQINQLTPITFNWKQGTDNGTDLQTGFLAQDVMKIFPELVDHTDQITPWTPDGMYRLNYVGLIAPAIRAIQEISATQSAHTTALANLTLNATGDINISDSTPSADFTVPHYYTLSDAFGQPIAQMGAFLELAVGNLRAGSIQTQQLFTNSLAIATSNVTIAGQSLHDYVAGIVNEVLQNNGGGLNSPIASVNQLHTGVISPLGTDDSIALSLNNSRLEVKNGASGSAVATIDNTGNATFSGSLNSKNLAVNGDATVSGTLHANRIEANQIAGLQAVVSTLSAQNITNVTNIYFATPSAAPTGGNVATGFSGSSSTNSGVLTPSIGYTNLASYSSFLAYVPNLNSDTAMFNQGLISLGATSLSDTTITGQLSIGTNFILADNSINVLGQSFEIQPLRQGGINLEGGLIAIDTDGNLTVNGNAVFAKNLAANVISPLANDRNLTLKLGENPTATGAALATSNFAVQNASGSGVFAINQLGDVLASGEATFGKLNLSLVQPALAVSNTEIIATGSAGTAMVKAHQTEITIDNKLVTNRSLIYITPVGQSNVTPYLLRQATGTSFTVGIPVQQFVDTTFNWLIVN